MVEPEALRAKLDDVGTLLEGDVEISWKLDTDEDKCGLEVEISLIESLLVALADSLKKHEELELIASPMPGHKDTVSV